MSATAGPRGLSWRRGQVDTDMLLAARPGEPGEPLGERGAGLGLADRERRGDFAHGQRRSRGGRALRQHRVGQHVNFLALDLAVLELAEVVLELLQVTEDLPVRDRVVQRREELQQVAQLLAAFAQVVQRLWGRGRRDRAALRGYPPERAPGGTDRQFGPGVLPAPAAPARLTHLDQRP